MSLSEQQDDHEMYPVENIDGRFVEVPARMKTLRRDGRNCPIPHCAEQTDGEKRLDPNLVIDVLLTQRCWVCNVKLGAHKVFLVEPAGAITRLSVLPPGHLECVLFMSNMDHAQLVTMLYVTKKFEVGEQSLFRMGNPEEIHFRYQAREATADEIAENLDEVIPTILEKVKESPEAVVAITEMQNELLQMVPGKRVIKPRKIRIAEEA